VQVRTDLPGGRKRVRTFKESTGSLYGFFPGAAGSQVWIVEDCLSAAAIAAHNISAVSLCGTVLPHDVRDALVAHSASSYVVALDPGAEQPSAVARRKLACYTSRPVINVYMDKDFKNMTLKEQVDTIRSCAVRA
jgi:hypothetical protein